MKKIIIILSVLFSELGVYSQNTRDTVIHIDEVKIIDSKINKKNGRLSICYEPNKLDSSVIIRNTETDLSELLLLHSHIFIKSYGQGSVATASIRGAGASHTKILWNGIVLNNPMTGQTDLSLIPVFFIDWAEIYTGGNSINSVSGALGGSINLHSDIQKEKFNSEFLQTAGSFKTFKTFMKIAGGTSTFRTSVKLFHEQSENNFKYKNTAIGFDNYERQKNADYYKTGILNDIFIRLSKSKSISVNTWLQDNKRNIPPIMSYLGSDRNENQEDNSVKSIITYYSKKNNYTEKISTSFISEKINYFLADYINSETFIRINSFSNSKQANLIYSSEFNLAKKLFFRTNLDVKYQKSSYFDKKTEIAYEKDRKIGEFFLSADYPVSKYFIAYSLIRLNNTDFNFLPLIPLAGIKYQPIKTVPLVFSNSISRNFHNPTLNDLYWIPGGNPSLKQEEGYSSDINADYNFKKSDNFNSQIKISAYASVINNQIVWQPGEYGFWTAQNINKVFSRGIETSLNINYHFNEVRTSLSGNYSYTKSTNRSPSNEVDNSYDKQLIYIPLNKANIHFNIAFLQWFVRISDSYTGKRFTNSSEENSRNELPAFNLLNLNFGRKISLKKINIESKIKIDNLLNTEYQEIIWRAMPGRQFMFTLRFEFSK